MSNVNYAIAIVRNPMDTDDPGSATEGHYIVDAGGFVRITDAEGVPLGESARLAPGEHHNAVLDGGRIRETLASRGSRRRARGSGGKRCVDCMTRW
jgi:hypothetical protein